jgi:hypothetical protein
MAAAHRDPGRQAEVLERLTASVGFTIAIMSRGDPRAANALAEGAANYLVTEAARLQKFGEVMK